jgi:hypothetical protein
MDDPISLLGMFGSVSLAKARLDAALDSQAERYWQLFHAYLAGKVCLPCVSSGSSLLEVSKVEWDTEADQILGATLGQTEPALEDNLSHSPSTTSQ